METESEILTGMVAVAQEYCGLIERMEEEGGDWLKRLSRLLPRLHAAVDALASCADETVQAPMLDLDTRFELYNHLRQRLGDRDSYWMEFDAIGQQHMSGSLADDLTDIYFDLKHGLELLKEAWPQQAAALWKSSYRLHWGQHLVDAERHLYSLKIRNQLELS